MTNSVISRKNEFSSWTVADPSSDSDSQSGTTTSTVVDIDGGTNVRDVSVIPFMREIDIDFMSYNLRPNRQLFCFFDDEEVTHFVEQPNKIVLDTKKSFQDFRNSPRETIELAGGNARVYLAETNQDTGNTTLYISRMENPDTNVTVGNTVTGLTSGLFGNVVSYEHRSGFVGDDSTVSGIKFSADASGLTANYFSGNVLTIVTGSSAGESSNIVSYNAVSRVATVSPAFSVIDSNSIYTIGERRYQYSANARQSLYTTGLGFLVGTLHLPNPNSNTRYSFQTGDRILRFLDNRRNDLTDYTTRSDYRFVSNGLTVDKQQIVNRTITTTVVRRPTVTPNPTVTTQPAPSAQEDPNNRRFGIPDGSVADPTAQSFYIDGFLYPEGIFVDSIDVFFKNKGDTLPIEMQIRPMIEGFPSASEVLPYASCILTPDEVNISDSPNTQISSTSTKFTFPSPIYLAPDREYAFCMLTNDYGYDVWSAELGEKILNTDRIVSRQPYLGTMFKSQSGRTFTPHQDEDVMFIINKCIFETSGSVVLNESKGGFGRNTAPTSGGSGYSYRSSNNVYDLFQTQVDAYELPGTKLTFKYKTTTNSNNTIESVYNEFKPEKDVYLNERKILYSNDIDTYSFYKQIQFSTTNPDVSPVVFYNRAQAIVIENKINNMGLSNDIIAIANTGSGYTVQNTALVITAPSGSGANAYISANATTGGIESIIVDAAGSGYYDNVSIQVVSSDGSDANLVVSGETSKSGGPALARYITKTITLADGFNAGDLRVFLDEIKPASANVQIYYKVRNALDPDTIEDKNWVRMPQHNRQQFYSTRFNPIEYEYRPSPTSNNITYTSDNATYKTFNQFKIKAVLASTGTVPKEIPALVNLRVIALPADIF